MTAEIVPIFKKAAALNSTLGALYAALKTRNLIEIHGPLMNLTKQASKDKNAHQPLTEALAFISSWGNPYTLMGFARDVSDRAGKDVETKQIGINALIEATQALTPKDNPLAAEMIAGALKKTVLGSAQETQLTDELKRICNDAHMLDAVELLAVVMHTNYMVRENRQWSMHETMQKLADIVKERKPLNALEAYIDIVDDREAEGIPLTEEMASTILELCRTIAPRDPDLAQEGLAVIGQSMLSPQSQVYKDADHFRSLLQINDFPVDHQAPAAMSPSEFSTFLKPKPF